MNGTEHEDIPLIAVVGMAGRFPGAASVREFWQNLSSGTESIVRLSDEELLAAGVDPSTLLNPNYVKAAAALEEIDMWDAGFFGFNPKEAAVMDPQHRLFLECAWEAFEDAGHAPEKFAGSIAVFAGCGMQSYFASHLLPNQALLDDLGFFLVRHTGNDKDFLATRVSYCFDLRGPSISVQTACSTSLVAIHMGAQSLLNRECDMVLAGGSSIELPHRVGYLHKEGEILSPDGHCRPFDADSQGTLFGSGAAAVVLRRLDDAIADGDHIYAVIRGSAVNNDGSGKVGYLAPSVEGQSRAAAEALAMADVDPKSVTYVETHGTGTPVGDPIEVAGLTQAYAADSNEQWCAIGSVKSNIGHLDTAAGAASFIKAALSLENGIIPASLNYKAPNPALDLANSPFYVNAETRVWPRGRTPRRAGVSSLGVGGTNAHVILEEAPARPATSGSRARQLFVLSARSADALRSASGNLAQFLEGDSGSIADAAFTLREGRSAFRYRRAFVARDRSAAVATLRAATSALSVTGTTNDAQRSVAFMFAGGGAQRPGMGRELYSSEGVYRAAVDESLAFLDAALRDTVRDLLLAHAPSEELAARLEKPSLALPALFITQYAMARLFQSWGVDASAMIGHSMGEYTAAHLAGVFSLRDALQLVSLRGRLFEQVERGGMLSVQLPASELTAIGHERVSVAAVNAPGLSVASGPVDALASLEKVLAARDIEFARVRIDVAAHSWMLDPILPPFREYLRSIKLAAPVAPFVSNLTGDWITAADAADPEYWVKHLRHTVLFADGVGKLLADRDRILLEVGPGRTLATLARMHPDAQGRDVFTGMRAHDEQSVDDADAALLALGQLWAAGLEVDWTRLRGDEVRRRVPLPTYPFERQRHWIDAPVRNASAGTTPAESAPVERLPAENWFQVPEWRRVVSSGAVRQVRQGTAIVLHHGSAFSTMVANELRSSHDRVVEVTPATAFAQTGVDTFTANPHSPEDFERLFFELSSASGNIADIVHLWTAGARDSDTLKQQEELAFYSLLHLLQGWGRWGGGKEARLSVVSTDMFTVGAEAPAAAWKSLAAGALRVVPAEFPEIAVRTIDVSSRDLTDVLFGGTAKRVVSQILQSDAPSEVAIRRNELWTPSYAPLVLGAQATPAILRENGVYIITGGFGGIGLLLAEELAQRCKARVVLAGRNIPAEGTQRQREVRGAIERCERAGGQVHAVAVDITAHGDADTLVKECVKRFGTVNGVFHAAGVLNDGLMQLRSDADCAAVLAPKVRGTLALDAAVEAYDLDLFVLFSSVSAVAGLPGQADYAAANAFMDAFAVERSSRVSGLTVAIEWATWREVGMTERLMGADSSAGMRTGIGSSHPLLQRVVQSTAEQLVFESALRTDSDWLVGEHRLRNGTALIPGTGYLEMAGAVAQAALPGSAFEIGDVAFLAPFVVPDGMERQYRVRLRPNGKRSAFTIAAGEETGWFEIATGYVAQSEARAEGVENIEGVRLRCTNRRAPAGSIATHPHLALGPRWDCVREVVFGEREALGLLSLRDEFRDDVLSLRLHPALLDMATACGLPLIEGYDLSRDFYVPLGYSRLTSLAPLTSTLYSHVRLADSDLDPREVCTFDITLYAADGRPLALIEGFMMTRVQDVNTMLNTAARRRPFKLDSPATKKTEQAPVPAYYRNGITPREGMDALWRVLGARAASVVYVGWNTVAEVVRQLRAPTPTAERAAASAAPVLKSIPEVEAVLQSHEAVEQCAATARRDRTGAERIVCYVVFKRDEHATVSDLRRHVKNRVRAGQVPSHFTSMDVLPRMADGAVDLAALPDPYGVADDFVAPRTPVEQLIAGTWSEALGVARVSAHDNFFDIGGHSLLAVRVVTKIDRALGVRLSQAIMVLQTLEQIAAECERQRAASPAGVAS